jgi:D-xylose 1-dehydrogenase
LSFAQYPSLKQAVVFITGGAAGIGKDMVRAFAEQGAHVGFVDIAADEGRALADELTAANSRVQFEPCDLRDIEALRAAFASLTRVLGPAGVLINNAARDDRHAWEGVTPEYYETGLPPTFVTCSSQFRLSPRT